jgi:hypothetical protein
MDCLLFIHREPWPSLTLSHQQRNFVVSGVGDNYR